MRFNPVTGYEQFTCPQCGFFLSIQRYIDLLSDYVCCSRCKSSVHVPSLIELETNDKPFHPAQLVRVVRFLPSGRKVTSVLIKQRVEQLSLFGGAQ